MNAEDLKLLTKMHRQLGIQDRVWRLKKYLQCFVGSELVTWMIINKVASSRKLAVIKAEELRSKGAFIHVVEEHEFEDAQLFYRFSKIFSCEKCKCSTLRFNASNVCECGHGKMFHYITEAETDSETMVERASISNIFSQIYRINSKAFNADKSWSSNWYVILSYRWSKGMHVLEVPKGENPDTWWKKRSLLYPSVMFQSYNEGADWLVYKKAGFASITKIINNCRTYLPKKTPKTRKGRTFNEFFIRGHTMSLGKFPMVRKQTKQAGKKKVNIKDFQNLKILGKGSFGEVMLVRKKDTKALYAAKIMKKKNLLTSYIPRLCAERDLMAFADVSCIVKLNFSFQDDEKLYLIMDFMQGGDLMGLLIEKNVFTVEATRFYIGQVCLAVHSVHVLGFCHRDLKPDNILLGKDGHVYLTDFGLSKQLTEIKEGRNSKCIKKPGSSKLRKSKSFRQHRTLAHSMVGTPDYMAPEIFEDNGYGEECDWWGVGCIMFECLAGYAPFYSGGETDIQDTVHNVKNWERKLNLDKVKRTDKNAGDLISKLICHYSDRLNFDGIKNHPFFVGFVWEEPLKNKVPYHKPEDLDDELDTRYFIYDPDESDSEESDDGVKKPVGKVENFTFYVAGEDQDDVHHVTDLWTHDDVKKEE